MFSLYVVLGTAALCLIVGGAAFAVIASSTARRSELLCINCDVCYRPLTKRREVRGFLLCALHERQTRSISNDDLRSIARGTCPGCDIPKMEKEMARTMGYPVPHYREVCRRCGHYY